MSWHFSRTINAFPFWICLIQNFPWSNAARTLPWSVHYIDVIMTTVASQITSLTVVYSTVYSVADQRKHQSSASLAFVRGIHRRPVNSPHKWPVTRKMVPFDDVIMNQALAQDLTDRQIRSHDLPPQTVVQLCLVIQEVWDDIPQARITQSNACDTRFFTTVIGLAALNGLSHKANATIHFCLANDDSR